MSRIDVEGTHNLRDVGARVPGNQPAVRTGLLFRSDSLHALTARGRASISELGIRTVVDLRSAGEIHRAPDAIDGLDIHRVQLPLYDGAEPASQIDLSLGLYAMYRDLVTTAGPTIAEIARQIAHSEGAVLVHCTAGKDRTGLAVAVILESLGVDRGVIVDDYATTEANLLGEWAETYVAQLTSHLELGASEISLFMTASPAGLLEQVLDEIDREFGGAAEYLRVNGLSEHDREILARKLLIPVHENHTEGETT